MEQLALIDLKMLKDEIDVQEQLLAETGEECPVNILKYVKELMVSNANLIRMLVKSIVEHPQAVYLGDPNSEIADIRYITQLLNLVSSETHNKIWHKHDKCWYNVEITFQNCYLIIKDNKVYVEDCRNVLTYDEYMKKFRASYKQ
jgi:hypothetical protein